MLHQIAFYARCQYGTRNRRTPYPCVLYDSSKVHRSCVEELPYLSRIERGRERPPKPELIKRMATLLGGDPDLLFRLADSTDPDLAEYIHFTPNVPEFLRTAKAMALTSEDFEALIEEVKRRRPSETATTAGSQTEGKLR